MSEKIYSLLLRLYPSRFRQRYQAEALQLLHDRIADERGGLRRLRLWFDLFCDLAWGLPRAYRNTYAIAAVPHAASGHDGIPVFASLHEEPLKPGSILLASLLSVATVALFALLMSLVSPYGPFSGANSRLSPVPNGQTANPDVPITAKEREAQVRAVAQLLDCGFDRLGVLPGNVGYVKVNWLADPAKCQKIVQRVAWQLNQADAVSSTCEAAERETRRWST